jgi:hypothetical protein
MVIKKVLKARSRGEIAASISKRRLIVFSRDKTVQKLLTAKLKMNRRKASVDAAGVFEDPASCWDGKGLKRRRRRKEERKDKTLSVFVLDKKRRLGTMSQAEFVARCKQRNVLSFTATSRQSIHPPPSPALSN